MLQLSGAYRRQASSPASSAARTTYFPTMSHSRFTRSRICAVCRFVCVHGERNHHDVEPVVAQTGDRQADAVDRDRALVDEYGASAGRKADRQPVELRVGPQFLDVPDGVDVPLHEVAAEPAVGAQRPLEIDERAPRQRAERRDAQRLRSDVGVNLAAPRATMTVRQTPLTARLSPGASSPASGDAMRRRTPPLVGLRSTSSPTASTRPVNITLNQHIRSERLDARARRAPPTRTAARRETARRPARAHAASRRAGRSRRRLRPRPPACSAAPPSSSSEPICRAPRRSSAARSVPSSATRSRAPAPRAGSRASCARRAARPSSR